MARDGSGGYSAPANSFNPAVSATTIASSDWNAVLADIETAIEASIAKDGQTPTSAVIPFASGIKADTIVENSANSGVTIDGNLLKDNNVTVGTSGQIVTDTIAEKTATAGVTIDSLLIKDGALGTADSVPTAAIADNAVTLAKLAGGTDGNLISYDASGDPVAVATGTANQVLTSNGAGAAPTFQAASSGPSQANQAAIEAETNEDTYVPPDLLKHSPGVAKAWWNFTGEGTVTLNASYNVTSVTDNGTGDYTVNLTDAFSGTDYGIALAMRKSNTIRQHVVVSDTTAPTVSAIRLESFNHSVPGQQDATTVYGAAYGDQ